MSDGVKSIKFKFQIDQQSFQSVQNAVKSLVADFQKLGGVGGGGAFPGLSIGGAAPSPTAQVAKGQAKQQNQPAGINSPAMGKVIIENANAFKKFAAEHKDASKIMTDALKRDLVVQENALDKLKTKLSNLNDEFKLAKQRQKEFLDAGNATGASAMAKHIENIEKGIAGTSGGILKGSSQVAQMQAMAGGSGGGGFGGFMRSIGYSGSGFGGGAGLLGGIVGAIGGAMAVGQFGLNEYREGAGGMDLRAEYRRGQLLNNRIRSLRRGDITQLVIQDEIRKDTNLSKYYDQQRDAIATAEAYAKGGMEGLGKLPIIKQALGVFGKGGGEGTALESLSTAEIQSKLLEAQQQIEGKVAGRTSFLDKQMALEYMQNTMGSRVNAQRIMGLTLEGRRGRDGKIVGEYADTATWAAKNFVDVGQVASNYAQARMLGGNKLAGALAQYETLSQAGGYGGMTQLAALASRGGAEGGAALQMARAALGGGIGVGAGMQLGQLAFGYNPLGTTSGTGFLAATQQLDWSKMSEGQRFNKVQAFGEALQAGNAIVGGTLDPATLGYNTLSAKRILGKGADSRAVDYLASGMDLKQMLDIGFGGDKATKAMNVYGISREQVAQQGTRGVADLMRSQLSDKFTGGTVAKVIKALESGMSPMQALKGLSRSERDQWDVAVQNRTKLGGPGAEALSDLMAGMGGPRHKKLKRGDALGNRLTGIEAASGEAAAAQIRDMEAQLQAMNNQSVDPAKRKALEDKIKSAREAANAQRDFGSNLSASVTDLNTHLDRLAGVIKAAADTIEGKTGEKPMPRAKERSEREETHTGRHG